MDTHDVSGLPEYSHHLQQQKQILRDAQSKQGRRPTFTLSRDETIMRFIVQKMRINPPVGSYALRSAFVPNAYTPSVTRLGELNKVMIKDLTLETHHRGSYVLLRAVTNTDRMNAIMTIVEDESTDVVLLQLYNYSKEASMDSRFREGTVLIVKEPYLKVTATGGFGIRVDHVSDIMFLPDHDDFMPLSWSKRVTEIDLSANDWKVKGNEFFTQSHYHFAIEWYVSNPYCLSISILTRMTVTPRH